MPVSLKPGPGWNEVEDVTCTFLESTIKGMRQSIGPQSILRCTIQFSGDHIAEVNVSAVSSTGSFNSFARKDKDGSKKIGWTFDNGQCTIDSNNLICVETAKNVLPKGGFMKHGEN